MELREAYELRRKEIISLRRENERLKKQCSDAFPVEEINKREKKIKNLEKKLLAAEKRCEMLHAKLQATQERCKNICQKNEELEERIKNLLSELKEADARAKKAEAEAQKLSRSNQEKDKKLNTNHKNSSLPSSALPFGPKVANNRKKSGKKPGGQKGHEGHSASRLTPTKEAVHLPAPDTFKDNPDIYKTGKTITKQLVDISVHVTVIDYVADEYRNRKTGSRMHAPFPEGLVNPVNYGDSLKAMVFMLSNYYNISTEKTVQCISDMTNGVISLSEGTVINIKKEFSKASEDERKKIISRLADSSILYSDATVSNVNGKRKAVILCTNKTDVLYQHFDHKGHDGLSKTPLMDFKGTVIHDHDRSYYSYGSSHQECLAHILRYLVGASELEPHLTWHTLMHDHIEKMIHVFKMYDRKIPESEKAELKKRYDEILALAEKEYSKNPPKIFMDGFNLQKRMREYRDAHLYFLDHPEVDPTNNISELCLRKFKRKQKQAVVHRSNEGAEQICDALTIIESARMQNKNIFNIVRGYFSKSI